MHFSFNPQHHPGKRGSSPFQAPESRSPGGDGESGGLGRVTGECRGLTCGQALAPGWPQLGPEQRVDPPRLPPSGANSRNAGAAEGLGARAPSTNSRFADKQPQTSMATWGPLCTSLGGKRHPSLTDPCRPDRPHPLRFLETSPPLGVETPRNLPLPTSRRLGPCQEWT